ncbi:MAG: hypothetical protein K2J36_02540, partial [Ruminococcus sp.]|nr:hypothetical protein [Ruminococcus sp.]
MKNIDNFLVYFIVLSAIAFTEKEKAEKSQTEKDTTEKQCKCTGNHCKNQQDFPKEILSDITECQKLLVDIKQKLV